MEHLNDWDLQAVVRSCATFSSHPHPHTQHPDQDPASLYALEYLDLDHKPKPLLPPSQSQSQSQSWPAGDDRREMMISFPAAAAASTSSALRPGRKPGIRNSTPRPRPKTSKKSQLKKVVCEVPVADGGVSSDLWAWRKYGQKPIKGSPYPRGYYKCSSLKGCMARKLVERSPAKPGVLVITYMAEHCHPVPTQINALAGTTRHKSTPADDHATTSPKSHGKADGDIHSNETSSMAVDGTTEEIEADDDWPTGLDLDEFLAPVGDVFHEDVALERRLSL